MLSGNLGLSPKTYQGLFESIVKVSAVLRESRVTVYNIDPLGVANTGGSRISYYQEFLKGVTAPSKVQPGDLGLGVLAIQSGGRVLNSSNDLAMEIARCVADADSYYVLGFDSARANRPNEYHSLELTVNKPGTTARTRTGYYAQP